MADTKFDPFNDRTSRNIRNNLSSAFAQAVRRRSPEIFRTCAETCLREATAESHVRYVQQRLQRYERAFREIASLDETNLLCAAIILWNHELFFEFHECIEMIWVHTDGPKHEALKGLIQAAGFHIHMERGCRRVALRLAKKASGHISGNRECLRCIANLETLIRGLDQGDSEPVKLEADLSAVCR